MASYTIFLDFDGVIVTQLFRYKWGNPIAIEALNNLLDHLSKRYNPEIVVSSTWRYNHTIEELQKLLSSWGCKGKVVGVTDDERGWKSREEVITDYVKKHSISNYICIDDERFDHPAINTDTFEGLTENDWRQIYV